MIDQIDVMSIWPQISFVHNLLLDLVGKASRHILQLDTSHVHGSANLMYDMSG